MYGTLDLCCVTCYVHIKQRLVLSGIYFGAEVESSFRVNLALCLAPPYQKLKRLHFLRSSLLARGSPFRTFTYFSNGLTGNISETEDIIDRVMGFL